MVVLHINSQVSRDSALLLKYQFSRISLLNLPFLHPFHAFQYCSVILRHSQKIMARKSFKAIHDQELIKLGESFDTTHQSQWIDLSLLQMFSKMMELDFIWNLSLIHRQLQRNSKETLKCRNAFEGWKQDLLLLFNCGERLFLLAFREL